MDNQLAGYRADFCDYVYELLQAQHPPRNGLRLPRPGYGTSDQKGAARTGQPYGGDIFGRRGRVTKEI